VHLSDVDGDAARALAIEYDVRGISTDNAEVIADPKVDTVIVALPTHLHHEWLLRCAEEGMAALAEKPLCRKVDSARDVARTFSQAGLQLSVGYMRRFSPARRKVRQLVQSGALGRPVTWKVSTYGPFTELYRPAGSWAWKAEQGGGFIMDGGIHDCDFACWVLGDPVEMHARSSRLIPSVTAATQASAIVRFEHGDALLFDSTFTDGDMGAGDTAGHVNRIVGPNGAIVIDSDYSFALHSAKGRSKRYAWDPNALRPTGLGWEWLFYKQLDAFIRNKGDDPCLATADEAIASLWMADGIVSAGPEGRTISYGT